MHGHSQVAHPLPHCQDDLHVELEEEADGEGLAILRPPSVDGRRNVHIFLQEAAGFREKILAPRPGERQLPPLQP